MFKNQFFTGRANLKEPDPNCKNRLTRGIKGIQKVLLCSNFLDKRGIPPPFGEMAEWTKAPHSKWGIPTKSGSGVQIPLSP